VTAAAQVQAGAASKQLAAYNAKVLKEQGKGATAQAAWESDRQTRQGTRQLAEIAAGQSSGGLGVSREVLRDQVLETARGVELNNWEGQYAGATLMSRAKAQQYEGKQKFYGGLISAAGTFASSDSAKRLADAIGGD